MVPTGDAKAPAAGFNPWFSDPQNTPLRVEVIANPKPDQYDLKLTK